LRRALYGLKQSARYWHEHISASFERLGFAKSTSDDSLYAHKDQPNCYILLYVDDLLIACIKKLVSRLKQSLSQLYEMTDMGPAKTFVGLEIVRNRKERSITVHQAGYAAKLLKRNGLDGSRAFVKPKPTPMAPGSSLLADNSTDKVLDKELHRDRIYQYQKLVGGLLYLMTSTRPDLAYTLSRLCKFNANPRESHERAAKHVLRYIAGTIDFGITYKPADKDFKIQCFSDSDFAGDADNAKSTGGYVFLVGGGAVTWRAKQQSIIARSSTEAEYVSASDAAQDAVAVKRLLEELGIMKNDQLIDLRVDNQSAIKLAQNPIIHNRTKHINVHYHFVRHHLGVTVDLKYVRTSENVADILTKSLPAPAHKQHVESMGMGTSKIAKHGHERDRESDQQLIEKSNGNRIC